MRSILALLAGFLITAPIIGATVGGFAYQFVRGEQTEPAPMKTLKILSSKNACTLVSVL